MRHIPLRLLPLAALLAVAVAVPAQADPDLTAVQQISADPFAPSIIGQHATEVEPDTFASGQTIVSAFQVGRVFDGGGTDIGFSTSTDGGATWTSGTLPGLTAAASGDPSIPYERVSDASVAYDATHGQWLISSIPITPAGAVPVVLVSRSSDGLTWSAPVEIPPPATKPDLDKNWTVCDSTSSPYRGRCYTEFDNYGEGDVEYMSTSLDGGATWSAPLRTAGRDKGLGGQPVVQPDGTVVVPFESLNGKISAFSSSDGGASWSKAVTISGAREHANSGGLRTSALPTAEVAADGTVYVAWQDCRFEKRCSANDIVLSHSADGVKWSTPTRIPIDAVGSGTDHFIPGLAVDPTSQGATTKLALTYYSYPDAACTPATCELNAGTISSPDGGASWGGKTLLAGPMSLSRIANTSQGRMVGDYISTSFLTAGPSAGRYTTAISVGKDPASGDFDQGMYAPDAPLPVATTGLAPASGAGASAVTGQGTGEAHHALRDE